MPPTSPPRTLLLFDPDAQPQCWNERMQSGEYAVLYSSNQLAGLPNPSRDPFCTVWSTLAEAEHATEQVTRLPKLRCRIYDHHGLAREPVREIRGLQHQGESEITARFRRWGGALFLLAGVVLIAFDWTADFQRSWPATVGVRVAGWLHGERLDSHTGLYQMMPLNLRAAFDWFMRERSLPRPSDTAPTLH